MTRFQCAQMTRWPFLHGKFSSIIPTSRGKKRETFTTLILSKLVCWLESWTLLIQTVKDQFYCGVMRLYRGLVKIPHNLHITDLQFLVRAGLPKPDELRCCRVRFFGTLHRCGQDSNWGLLCQDHAWITLLSDDLCWLWDQIKYTSDLKDPKFHCPVWKDLLFHHGDSSPRLLEKNSSNGALPMPLPNVATIKLPWTCIETWVKFFKPMDGSLICPPQNTLRLPLEILDAWHVNEDSCRMQVNVPTCLRDMAVRHQPAPCLLRPIAQLV